MIELLPSLATLGLLSLFARFYFGTWAIPGAFFAVFWWLLSVISIALVPEYVVTTGAMWWITGTCAVFLLGNMLIVPRAEPVATTEPPATLVLPGLQKLVYIVTACAFAYIPVFDIYVFDINTDHPPVFIQPLLTCLHLGPVLGGILFVLSRSWSQRYSSFLPLLPQLLFCLITSGRSGLVVACSFWFSGFLVTKIYLARGRTKVFSWQVLISATLVFLMLAGLGTFLTRMRGIYKAGEGYATRLVILSDELAVDDDANLWLSFRHGVFGHIYSFSYWYENAQTARLNPTYGVLFFHGPMKLLGFMPQTGAQTGDAYEAFEVDPGVWSNVYTQFMPLINEFTFTGSMIVVFCMGIITGWAFRRVVTGTFPASFLLVMFYTHTLSIGGLFFSYNTVVLAHVLTFTYLYIACRMARRPGPVLSPAPEARGESDTPSTVVLVSTDTP